MGNSRIHCKAGIKALKSLPVLFLLLVYGLGCLEVSSIHSFFHDPSGEADAIHTPKEESNACHQSAYHNLKGSDCKHKAHFMVLKKCPLCQLSMQTFHLVAKPSAEAVTLQLLTVGRALPALVVESFSSCLPPRAPPVS